MIHDAALDDLLQKVWDGQRIDRAEALRLHRLPLEELGALAHRRRELAKARAYDGRGNGIVTYIVDRNINYTNVCNVYCKFCAFYRTEKDADAYVIRHDEMDRKIEETLAQGGTQILLQGGHHPKLTLDWYLDLLSHIKSKFPQINLHAFSPPEFIHFQKVFDLPVEEIIKKFVAAGLGSIPGGGAEILVDRVRQRVAPRKATTDEWLGVMDTAHRLGLRTTATMMFGHVETVEDRIEHFDRVRAQQDKSLARGKAQPTTLNVALPLTRPADTLSPARSGGEGRGEGAHRAAASVNPEGAAGTKTSPGHFTAFICWTFQPENTHLKAQTVGAHEYLRTQALARIYLDNFDNVQSSWVTQGPEIGQIALKFGANDLGSIMLEENVVRQAGASFRMSVADMHRLIQDLGYEPRQRDNWYRLVN